MGDEVAVIDNLSTSDITNVQHLEGHDGFTCKIDDILNFESLRPLIDNCDMIYHLAAAVGVEYVLENPLQTLTTNIRGTEHVLELANEKKKKVILASTSEIYGKKNGNVPFREDSDRILGPTTVVRWSYSTTKAVDELLALAYWKEKRLPVVIGPALQRDRPPSDRAFRHGGSPPDQAGCSRSPDHGIRQRRAAPLLDLHR